MKPYRNCLFLVLFCTVAAVLLGQTRSEQTMKTATEATGNPPIDCSGTVKACTKPAKFLTRTSSCVCFTCAYGTPAAKQLCTKTSAEAKSFAALARESGFADAAMDKAVAGISLQEKQRSQPHNAELHDTQPAKGPGL